MISRESLRVAIYARVSSDQQVEAGTINSQIDALKQRVRDDGFDVEHCFVDDGYSGATLLRPALERLRDVVDTGAIDRVYVHSPDRLARKYAYQVVLMDELQRCGVEVMFLNHKDPETPEEDLLLQVQGMVAEYERAKILERSRRGKLHAARRGSVSVLGGAPYGYEYIPAALNGGAAEYRISLDRAGVARRMFEWVGRGRLTICEVCRRLQSEGIKSPSGSSNWSRRTVRNILKNPAYKGLAAYGKTRLEERRQQLRPRRSAPQQPRRAYSCHSVPSEEWMPIPVPAIVREELFESVQEQLIENRRVAQQRARGATYLLQGLVVCERCGYAMTGRKVYSKTGKLYTYYRCLGTEKNRFGGNRICKNKQIRTDLLENAVWNDVCDLLKNPERVKEEFERRLIATRSDSKVVDKTRSVLRRLEKGVSRLIDAYADGVLDKSEFEPRVKNLRERISRLEAELSDAADNENQANNLKLVLARIEDFTERVRSGLDTADWNTQREVIRAIVRRIEVDDDDVRVVYRVDPRPFVEAPQTGGVLRLRNGRGGP